MVGPTSWTRWVQRRTAPTPSSVPPLVPHSTSTTLHINTAPQATAINGHGGTRSMQSANPFLYVVQIGTFLLLIPAGHEEAGQTDDSVDSKSRP
ncbi:hypothetical protein MRX96_006212 [Rhipicephalus microplus]